MTGYITPGSAKTNSTALSKSALQVEQCNQTLSTISEPKNSGKLFKVAKEIKQRTCDHTVFVHDSTGKDLFDGTFTRPMKTIQAGLSLTRTVCTIHGRERRLRMTIHGGTSYPETNTTTSSSQIGAIALTSNAGNLIIENYQDERVILGCRTLLQLKWTIHGIIMEAQIPSYVNLQLATT